MQGEGPAVSAGNAFKGVYCILYFVNSLHHPSPRIRRVRRIVSLLPLALHIDESACKVLDLLRELPHSGQVVALISCVPMLQCPIGLYPSCVASGGSSQPACAAKGHGMKKGVVGRANSTAKFSLSGPTPASAHRTGSKLPGNSYQIMRIHGICPGIRSLWIFFHSDFSINTWPGVLGNSPSGR